MNVSDIVILTNAYMSKLLQNGTSTSGFAMAARKTRRPMRPKPLMPIFAGMIAQRESLLETLGAFR